MFWQTKFTAIKIQDMEKKIITLTVKLSDLIHFPRVNILHKKGFTTRIWFLPVCYQKIKVYNASNETIQHPRTRSLAAYFFCFREEAPENFARSVSKQSLEIKKGIAFIHDLLHLKRFEVDHQRELPVLLRKLPWRSN